MKTQPDITTQKRSAVTGRTWLVRYAGVAAAAVVLAFAGCAQRSTESPYRFRGGYAPPSASESQRAAGDTARSEARSGLGTGFGEERDSHVSRTGFVRVNGNQPAVVDSIFYNDRAGIEAMLAHEGGAERRANDLARMAGGFVSVGLKDGSGRWLDGWRAGANRFIAGERGERYEIVIRNETRERKEIVLSVDGLDVMDGRSASFSKRGYIVYPGDTLTVDGFRTSSSTVAAFRFSRVDRSYAALKHGNTRNVGVIGIAVFSEREPEVWRRRGANPFPGSRWATPPPE